MYPYLGDFPTGHTIEFPFHTFDSNDPSASVTITGLAVTDIEVYKNGGATQRSSDNGYTLLDTDGIDFDGITGIHGFSIDTSDNSDAGFFAAGNDYIVVVSSITVDAATVNFIAGAFSIDNRGLLRPTTAQRTLDVTATGAAGIDWGNIENPTTAVDLSGTDIQLCDTVTTNSDMVGTDNAALASVCTEARLSELDAATAGKAANQIDEIRTDTEDIQSRLPAALVGGRMDSNLGAVDNSTNRVTKFSAGLDNTMAGDVVSATDAENFVIQLLAGDTEDATDDTYNGRFLTFTNGNNIHQTGKITDYNGTTKAVVFAAGSFTTTPAAGDDFVIT